MVDLLKLNIADLKDLLLRSGVDKNRLDLAVNEWIVYLDINITKYKYTGLSLQDYGVDKWTKEMGKEFEHGVEVFNELILKYSYTKDQRYNLRNNE